MLLAQFWPNFKGRFMGPFWTYPNCHNDICPGNISPCDICPYQEYLSCYWPDFDQILKVGPWDHLEHFPTISTTTTKFCQKKILLKNVSTKNGPNFFLDQKSFLTKKVYVEKIFGPKMFFVTKSNFRITIFSTLILVWFG